MNNTTHVPIYLFSIILFHNPVDVIYGGENTYTEFGSVYDKKPFRVDVKKYHLYTWCGCGISTLQPFCDGKACVHP